MNVLETRTSNLSILRQDVRFAVRSLWRGKGFALVAILSLGLGIGVFATGGRELGLRKETLDLLAAPRFRNLQRDRDDFVYLAETVPLDLAILKKRYTDEMHAYLGRPEREDVTLQLWIDIVQENRNA